MNQRSDIDRVLEHWFDRRPDRRCPTASSTSSPTGSSRQPQRPAWRLPMEGPRDEPTIKLVAAVAAVLVDRRRRRRVSRRRTRARVRRRRHRRPRRHRPIASAAPSTAPSASAVFPPWFTDEPPTEPGSCLRAARRPGPSGPASHSACRRAGSTTVIRPISTGCSRTRPPTRPSSLAPGAAPKASSWGSLTPRLRLRGSRETTGATAAELVASLVANEALVTSEPVDVTIGGLTGKQSTSGSIPTGRGAARPILTTRPRWTTGTTGVGAIFLDSPGGGKLVIFVGSVHAADHEAFLAEAMPIVESFEFDLEHRSTSARSIRRARSRRAGASPRGSRAAPARARSPRTAP